MKRFFYIIVFAIFSQFTNSQIIHIETGKTISTFDYFNSEGKKLENLEGSIHNSLGLGIRKPIKLSKYTLSCGITYNRYGAKGSNPEFGSYFEWDVHYLGINAGIGYEFYRPPINYNEQHGFSVYPKIIVATDFLLDGNQNLNNQMYNLRGEEEFNLPLFFLKGSLCFNYYLSRKFTLFAEYTGGKSFLIGDYNNKEQLRICTHNVSVGVALNLYYLHE